MYGLLGALQDKKVNVNIINVLHNWYTKCYASVRWGNCVSNFLPLISGVRQGGILSPLLFNLYVDIVLTKLESSKLGCFYNCSCYNSLMYADDLILISISVVELQSMINLCADVLKELDLIKKCSLLHVQQNLIPWTDSMKFLGIIILQSSVFKCSWSEAKKQIFCELQYDPKGIGTVRPLKYLDQTC